MRSLKRVLAGYALTVCAVAASAGGQVSSRKSLTLEGARRVIAAAEAEAKKVGAPGGVIAVVDDGGSLMAVERLDGTFTAGANISIGKARTAVMFKKPTKVFEDIIKNGRTSMVALESFTPLQGGIPIMYEGDLIGGVGVSGAASAAQDEQLAIAGAEAAKAFDSNSADSRAGQVLYFDRGKVQEGFAKGSVLYDGNGGERNYMVHTSHREQAGMAEVHSRDTDIIYVLKGTATFVTSGTAVDLKPVAPDEFRGVRIDGGETRLLGEGDVIIVPNGVPHWFKEIPAAFNYYVVKVR